MSPTLQQKFIDRWPTWFDVKGDMRRTLMPFGFTIEDGWFDIVWRLCEDLEALIPAAEIETGEKFEVFEVKQKMGGLLHERLYRVDQD